jgi:hypothetical protein
VPKDRKSYGYRHREDPEPGLTAGGHGQRRARGDSVQPRIDPAPAVNPGSLAIGGADSRVTMPPTEGETRKVANVVKKFRGGLVIAGLGSPETVRIGNVGVIYEQIDGPAAGAGGFNHPLWVKWTGSGTTGWRRIFAGVADKTVYIGGGVGGDGNTEPGTFFFEGTAVGMGSLTQTRGGTAVGYASFVAYAGNNDPNAQYGCAFGHTAGVWTGNDGIAIGHGAKVGAVGLQSTGSIAIGGTALTTASFASNYSIALGWEAWTGVGAVTHYSIALGAYAKVGTAGSNVLQIGGTNIDSGAGDAGISTVIIGNGNFASNIAGVGRDVTIRLSHSVGTDQPGATLTIDGGRGTGAGVPGKIFLRTTAPLGSGSTGQSFATRMTIDHDTVTLATGVSLVLPAPLPIAQGGTALGSYTNGDLIYASATNVLAKLAIGTAAQVLTVTDVGGGDLEPRWAANPAGFADPMTTRGDIIYRAAATARLGIGTASQVLTVTDIGAGVLEPRWQAASGSGSFAPIASQYLVLALDATLTGERRFIAAGSLEATDAGANGDYTLTGISELRKGREYQILKTPGAATLHCVGFTDTAGITLPSNADDSVAPWMAYTTAATIGSVAGHGAGTNLGRMHAWKADCTSVIKTGGDISSIRIWQGNASASVATVATPTTQHVAAFRYSTDVDGTAFWRCVTHDGGATPTVTTTTSAIAINTIYTTRIVHGATDVKFYINGTLVATHTTALPGATTALFSRYSVTALAASSRVVYFSRTGIYQPD